MTDVLIVYNPVSGNGNQTLVETIAASLREQGQTVALYPTQSAGDATRYLQSLTELPRIVAAAGGDGTVNEVLNGLAAHDNQSYQLAIIPTGTTNVLAMELGIRKNARQIAATLLGGKEKAVYPGRVNERRFMLMTGIGYDAWVVDNVDLALKKRVGKLAYVMSMLRQLRHFGRKTYRLAVDGQTYEANSVIITNGRLYGGSFVLSKQADLSLPTTQVLMMKGSSPFKLLLILLGLPLGVMEKMPGMTSVAARDVQVRDADEGAGREPVQADGDSLAELPVRVQMDAVPLRVLIP
ncbi:diacylglycerol/lipid kinase family protein [Thalassolituus sp. LLYu03]|uniref:diacylglycerol/lipid kinase family protein n=1 Tax=Thalassolituus sp. LLYu03 TaxID=3421656 RepID=UPI003D2BBD09